MKVLITSLLTLIFVACVNGTFQFSKLKNLVKSRQKEINVPFSKLTLEEKIWISNKLTGGLAVIPYYNDTMPRAIYDTRKHFNESK